MSFYQFEGQEPEAEKHTFVPPAATAIRGVSNGESRYVRAGAVVAGATHRRRVMPRLHPVMHDGVRMVDQPVLRAHCVVLGDAALPPGNLVVSVPVRVVGEVTQEQQYAWDPGLEPCPELLSRCEKSWRHQERPQ